MDSSLVSLALPRQPEKCLLSSINQSISAANECDWITLRDSAIAHLMIECGLKPSQIVELKRGDTDGRTLATGATWGRTGVLRILLPKRTATWICAWLRVSRGGWLFYEDPERRWIDEERSLTTRTVSRRMALLGRRFRIEKMDGSSFGSGWDILSSLVVKDSTSKKSQWVYFLQAKSGPIKIGFSCHPVKRKKEIETARGESMSLLCLIVGGAHIERSLHYRFADERIEGEWFSPSERILAFIRDTNASQLSFGGLAYGF
jgi:hypothetical protein